MRIGIVVPSAGQMKASMVSCLINLITLDTKNQYQVSIMQGSNIGSNRSEGARQAMEHGCEAVLFVDDDITFPPSVVNQLLERNHPIIACAFMRRAYHKLDMTTNMARWDDLPEPVVPITLADDLGEKPVVEMQYVGFGLVLVKSYALQTIPQPWFSRDQGTYSEDYTFCENAFRAGFTVRVDLETSKLCGHLVQVEHRFGQDSVGVF